MEMVKHLKDVDELTKEEATLANKHIGVHCWVSVTRMAELWLSDPPSALDLRPS